MNITKLLETEKEYEEALSRIEVIFHAQEGSSEAKELQLLVYLVQKYEDEKYPLTTPDPIEAIQIRMQDLSLTRKDLEPYLGDKTVVSKILNRKRELTLEMIRRLHVALSIPAEILLGTPST